MVFLRKKGSDITAADFREAVESFGLGGDKANADRLFKAYDWRQNGSVQFQVKENAKITILDHEVYIRHGHSEFHVEKNGF